MENYVTAAGLYLCGIVLYFIYVLFIQHTPKNLVKYVHSITPDFSDATIFAIICVICLLDAFVWPVSSFLDLKNALKGGK